MDSKTLQLFTQQMAHWADSFIQQGRFPFRKVETFPSLLTPAGEKSPPLLLWINKDSFMAGGLILFPHKNSDEFNDTGCECAEALGLRHFVAWAPKEIVFWNLGPTGAVRHKTITLNTQDVPDKETFRDALVHVLEEIKFLSVMAAAAPTELSPYYLVNFWHGAIESSIPFILETYQMARGECRRESSVSSPDFMAYQKASLALLRLIALVAYDKLPASIQPEGLERATFFALENLPTGLQSALKSGDDELPLPPEACTRLHHFFRRMLQLPQRKSPGDLCLALKILMQWNFHRLGGRALPAEALHDTAEAPLLLNPDRESGLPQRVMEIAPQAILAYTSLQRILANRPECRALGTTVLNFTPPTPPSDILGTLHDSSLLSMQQRHKMGALLRGAWPNRRFQLPPTTPLWVWEFIHLLGIAGEGANFAIKIPDSWLLMEFGDTLFDLLCEQFTLSEITQVEESFVLLKAQKRQNPHAETSFTLATGVRTLDWEVLRHGHRSFISLALLTPDTVFHLLGAGKLHIPQEASWPTPFNREVFLFIRSTLGRFLWNLLAAGAPLPSYGEVKAPLCTKGIPIPTTDILEKLQAISWKPGDTIPKETVDSELSLWLLNTEKIDVPEMSTRPARERKIHRGHKGAADKTIRKGITEIVFRDGLPQFPEHYLYDYFKPKLKHFHWLAPLHSDEGFLGRYTLRDSLGTILEVEGLETARALVLASYSERKSATLPEDRQLTAAILDRYISDLKGLRQSLSKRVHKHVADPREADKLINAIWEEQGLPPQNLFSD